jgi:tRNA (cmo5U34)-methyltransferase
MSSSGHDPWRASEAASAWDAGGADALPTRAEQQRLLLALLDASRIGENCVLDLGVGTGLVAEVVLDALPSAGLVGVDSSPSMLDLARSRLERFGKRVHLQQGDLARPDAIELPARCFKAAFSVQTLHHLGGERKRAAFTWIADVVEPGALVVVVDRVTIDEELFADWQVVWRLLDPATTGTYADHVLELMEAGDQPSTLEDQIGWMKAAGLATCCLHLYGNRALLVGRKVR